MFVDARDVRLRPGRAVGVHAAALRLVPDPGLLDLRAQLVVDRDRADRRRGRDRAGSSTRSAAAFLGPRAGSSRRGDRDAATRTSSGTTCTSTARSSTSSCAAALVLLTLVVAERPSLLARGRCSASSPGSRCSATRASSSCRSSAPSTSPGACRARARPRSSRPRARRRRGRRHAVARPQQGRASAASRSRPTAARCGRRTTRSTYGLLSSGQWIDNVAPHPPRPPSPASSRRRRRTASRLHATAEALASRRVPRDALLPAPRVAVCATIPGDKAKLAALSAKLLWQPNVFETSGRRGAGTSSTSAAGGRARVHVGALRARRRRPLLRAARVRRARAAAARVPELLRRALFVGATRYRVAWDFLLALLAAAGVRRLARR